MKIRTPLAIAAVVASVTLALAGCAGVEPVGDPIPTPDATQTPAQPSTDPSAAWLDGGHAVGLVTWGSSSLACVPKAVDVTGDGQTVQVTLAEPDKNAVCTADFAPRATYVEMPAGVDPTKDVTVSFQGGEFAGRVPLTGLADKSTGGPREMKPSAGWFDPSGIVLLTWGSSTCPPVVGGFDETDGGATVTFSDDMTGPCTMDMAPRLTILGTTTPHTGGEFTLTLTGGHLDGKVTVLG
ncbi:MAG: hypothetical protein JSS74_06605 [Actinobacteria bacterium]|nr:hypothetical protein [Actinomycetota bacterium]